MLESVAVIVKVNVPAVVGVPDKVLPDKVRPDGRLPLAL